MRGLLLGLVLALGSVPAMAASWRIDREQSQILFSYLRADQPDQGAFTRFAGEGVFDPANPNDARLEIRISSGSIDLRDTVASAFATSAEWFDSKNHPDVVYRLTSLVPVGQDIYNSTGTLSIRGRTKQIEAPLTLRIENGRGTADGALVLDRTDYLLGVGPSAAFVSIGPEVTVTFQLRAIAVE